MAEDKKSSRQELIRQAMRVSKNTQAKIRRYTRLDIKLNDNVTVEFNRIRRYNERQLKSYIDRVTRFNKTQYVRGHNGTPINKNAFNAYKTLERKANERVQKKRVGIDRVMHPGSDMTLGQFRAMGKEAPRPEQRVTVDPLTEIHRTPHGLTSNRALQKLVKDTLRRGTDAEVSKRTEAQRGAAKKVFEYLGMDDVAQRFDELTEEQFGILWRTDIVNKVFTDYTVSTHSGMIGDDRAEGLRDTMDDYISWASQH